MYLEFSNRAISLQKAFPNNSNSPTQAPPSKTKARYSPSPHRRTSPRSCLSRSRTSSNTATSSRLSLRLCLPTNTRRLLHRASPTNLLFSKARSISRCLRIHSQSKSGIGRLLKNTMRLRVKKTGGWLCSLGRRKWRQARSGWGQFKWALLIWGPGMRIRGLGKQSPQEWSPTDNIPPAPTTPISTIPSSQTNTITHWPPIQRPKQFITTRSRAWINNNILHSRSRSCSKWASSITLKRKVSATNCLSRLLPTMFWSADRETLFSEECFKTPVRKLPLSTRILLHQRLSNRSPKTLNLLPRSN